MSEEKPSNITNPSTPLPENGNTPRKVISRKYMDKGKKFFDSADWELSGDVTQLNLPKKQVLV